MSAGVGTDVMIGVPEITSVVLNSILVRVIQIDVEYMTSQIVHQLVPTLITCQRELSGKTCQRIILIVVMRVEILLHAVQPDFVISIQFAKVPPAILVHLFAFGEKVMFSHEAERQQGIVLGVRMIG